MTSMAQVAKFATISTVLGDDVFLFNTAVIRESISDSFDMAIWASSIQHDIKPEKLIGTPVMIQCAVDLEGEPRYFHGIIDKFSGENVEGTVRNYVIHAVPWLELLSYATDCRIFQQLSVVDILKKIFAEFNIKDFDFSKLHGSYEPMEYCTQYHETYYTFIHRLLAEAGIYYYFQHQKNKHVVVFEDTSTNAKKCLSDPVVFDATYNKRSHAVSEWRREQKIYTGKTEFVDYNFEKPSDFLSGKSSQVAKLKIVESLQQYHPDNHDTQNQAEKQAKLQFEANESEYDIFQGASTYITFAPGAAFQFLTPPNEKEAGEYFIRTVIHLLGDKTNTLDSQSAGQHYANQFECQAKKIPYRVSHLAYPKPFPRGPHLAQVVGPKGESIYTDKYGRIKIRFYWLRGESLNEKTSCWVRVVQPWAGNGFGMMSLPRIGDEVVVDFVSGDIDKPLVRGSVYNAQHMPPFELPVNKAQTGIKTQTVKGGVSHFNALRFDDTQGKEEVYLRAEKDMNVEVKHDKKEAILEGDSTVEAKAGKLIFKAAKAIELHIGGSVIILRPDDIRITGTDVTVNG